MSLVLDGGNGVTFPNSTTQASAGSVIQVVSANYQNTGSATTTSSTLTSTGMSISITPKFSTSKILVVFSGGAQLSGLGSGGQGGGFTFYRGGSNLATGTAPSIMSPMQASATGNTSCPMTLSWIDSPATTSSTTYTIYFATNGGANITLSPAPAVANTFASVFYAMEIAA